MKFQATIELGGKTATGFEVPAEVVAALGGGRRPAVDPTLRARFDALSFTNRNEHGRLVESAKTEATRQRRLAKIVTDLGGSTPS